VPSPWPSPAAPVPRAALVGTPPAAKPGRPIRRWLIAAVVLLAFVGVFRRANRDGSGDAERGSARKGQIGPVKTPTLPDLPPLPPEAEQGVKQGLEEAKQGLNQGLQEMRKGLRAALAKSPEAQQAEARRLAEEARAEAAAEQAQALEEAKAAAKQARAQRRAAAGGASVKAAPEVRELLADAEEALDDDDPKLALRLAEQSFFTRKTSAGYAIKARAHCQLKDLGSARAALANVTVKADRNRVLGDCKSNGIDLR
jgi:hypothetical protein